MNPIFNKTKDKTAALLKQGLSPRDLIQSIIFSALLSIIPILGISTFLITTVSIKKKLNLPVMIALSYLMWPVQILLIIPFIKLGGIIFSLPQNHHSVEKIIDSFQNSFFKALTELSFDLFCGLCGWFITAAPISMAIYWISLLLIKKQ